MSETLSPPPNLDDAAYQHALAVLLDVGTSLAQELKAPSPDLPVTDRANAFERVALAVRRTVILSRHVAEVPTILRPAPLPADTKRVMQRRQVIRAVEETIEHKADRDAAAALRRELLERVEAPDFDADLTHRKPADIIRDLCRDLGLADVPGLQTFPRRTPEDIARLNAQAAALPGGPPIPRGGPSSAGSTGPRDGTATQSPPPSG